MHSRSKKKNVNQIISLLNKTLGNNNLEVCFPFEKFLEITAKDPYLSIRNVFQLFHDMIHYYTEEFDEYEDDPENIKFKTINTQKLFVKNTDTPFFADLPIANRLIKLANSFKEGAQQNKIYVFIGPPGSGKSTFLNNLLLKFQEYTKTPNGMFYETVWQIENGRFGVSLSSEIKDALSDYYSKRGPSKVKEKIEETIEIPCPSHDHPLLIIPKEHRRDVLENLLSGEALTKIMHKKEYEWLFKNNPCTICSSMYKALVSRLKSPTEVFDFVYVKRFTYDRRLGSGISVYNPGDHEPEQFILSNPEIQKELSSKFRDSNLVKYIYSRYAKTNNGVLAIMDVKGQNEKRLLELHGIISEGVHKIDDFEENVNSLFIAVMNPEDKRKFGSMESFKDRMTQININYILNYEEEVNIYYSAFGTQIQNNFLPRVLENFAKIIISSRLISNSDIINQWITNKKQYDKYCDENMLLLKMGIYSNVIPNWLSVEDFKKLDKNMRKIIIDESENEGQSGFSGRESITIFNDFYTSIRSKSRNGKIENPITMDDVKNYFLKNDQYYKKIPKGFIDSLIRLYDYDVMEEVKEALFHQNEERISKDIQNYLFASNFDLGDKKVCSYTGETIEINEQFFSSIENTLLGEEVSKEKKDKYRDDIAEKFAVNLQSIESSGTGVTLAPVYSDVYNLYMNKLRKNILQPLISSNTFENALKDFNTEKFEIYDDKTKERVRFLINNLMKKFSYSLEGAVQVCLYIIQNKVAERFKD